MIKIQYIILLFSIVITLKVDAQSTKVLSITEVIEAAKNKSFSIQKAEIQVEMAHAQHQESKEWWLPELKLGTSLHHLEGASMNTDGAIFRNLDRQNRWYGGQLSFDWDIGRGLYSSKSKSLSTKKAMAQSQNDKNEALLGVVENYYHLLRLTAQKELILSLINQKANLVQQLLIQVEAGIKTSQELLLNQSNLSRLRLQLMSTESLYQSRLQTLYLDLQLDPEEPIQLEESDLQLVQFPTELASIENHPKISAKNYAISSMQSEKSAINKGLLFPNIDLTYAAGAFGEDYSDADNTRNWTGFLGWKMPLGRLIYGGANRVAESKIKMGKVVLEEEKVKLINESVYLQNEILHASEMLLLAEQSGQYAKQALNESQKRQENGIGDLYEVLIAQEEYLKSSMQYYEALTYHNILQYRLWINQGNSF